MIKRVLITGGSGGIGKQTAISLAKEGLNVIITGRSLKSALEAVNEIKELSKNNKVDFIITDFNSLKSVQILADEFKRKYDSLDVLINNVGYLSSIKEFTIDGIEKNFAINVLSPYLLSNLLFDLLEKSDAGRIITLTGGFHPSELIFENLQSQKKYKGIISYSHSKLAMMALMLALGNSFGNTRVKSNICYPGQANTAMTRALSFKMFPWYLSWLVAIIKLINSLQSKNVDKSAKLASKSSVYLALNNEAQVLHNSYVNYKCELVKFPVPATNAENQHKILMYADKILNERFSKNFNSKNNSK